jgi:hypothetical protein
MVETARQCGASAKFAGSGARIIGTYDGDEMFDAAAHGTRRDRGQSHRPQIYAGLLDDRGHICCCDANAITQEARRSGESAALL